MSQTITWDCNIRDRDRGGARERGKDRHAQGQVAEREREREIGWSPDSIACQFMRSKKHVTGPKALSNVTRWQ